MTQSREDQDRHFKQACGSGLSEQLFTAVYRASALLNGPKQSTAILVKGRGALRVTKSLALGLLCCALWDPVGVPPKQGFFGGGVPLELCSVGVFEQGMSRGQQWADLLLGAARAQHFRGSPFPVGSSLFG